VAWSDDRKKIAFFSKKIDGAAGTAAHALFQKKKSAHFSFCHNMIQGHPAVKGYAPLAARASVMAHLLEQELACYHRKFGIAKVDARRLNSVYYYYCVKCTTTQTEDCFTPTSREHQRCRHCHNGKQMERPSICTGKRKQGADNQKRDQRPYMHLYCEAMARIDLANRELAALGEVGEHMPDIDQYQWCFECKQALSHAEFTPSSSAKHQCKSCHLLINVAKKQQVRDENEAVPSTASSPEPTTSLAIVSLRKNASKRARTTKAEVSRVNDGLALSAEPAGSHLTQAAGGQDMQPMVDEVFDEEVRDILLKL